MHGVMPQHSLDAVELESRLLASLLFGQVLLNLFVGGEFDLLFHVATSSGFFKQHGESFACPVQFPAHGVGGLLS
jgi:hypothetical protein